MSAPPPSKRTRGEASAFVDDSLSGGRHATEDWRALLHSALGYTAALLRVAKHSGVAQSLVTADEDAVEASVTCGALLLREHGIGLDVTTNGVRILAALAEGEPTSWRALPRLCEHAMSASLASCDEHFVQQLHTITEVLRFPKHITLLLQRELAVLRIRKAAAGGSATATLVRAEAVLAPLLDDAEGFVKRHLPMASGCPLAWKCVIRLPSGAASLATPRLHSRYIPAAPS